VIRGALEEVEMAMARVEAARAERRPMASVNTFVAGGSAASIVGSADPVQPRLSMGLPGGAFLNQNVSLMAPLFTGGRLQAMVRQAGALQAASRAELETMRQDVALMVRIAYREVQARDSQLAVYRAMLDQNRERQRIDQIAYQQEKIPRFYLLRNEAEIANAQQLLTGAERDREVNLLQLKTVMGIHLESRLELVQPLEFRPASAVLAAAGIDAPAASLASASAPEPIRDDRVLTRLLELAGKNRPELAAAGGRVTAGKHEVDAAKSAFMPQVSAGVMGDWMRMRGGSPFGGSTFAVVGSLPVLDGGLRKARLRSARSEVKKLEEQRQQAALQIGQEVRAALLDLRAAEKNVATARTGLAAAEEDYRVALLRYTAGKGINVEALDALAAHVRAQNNHVQALFEYAVAQDRLARSIGVITPAGDSAPNG
jgi:outer membrane protein